MNIPGLITAFLAVSDIAAQHLVAAGTNDGEAIQAKEAATYLLGASTFVNTPTGKHVSVVRNGLANVVYGGNLAVGDPITSNADGQAIKAAAGDKTIGYAEVSGVAGDIGSIYIVPGVGA